MKNQLSEIAQIYDLRVGQITIVFPTFPSAALRLCVKLFSEEFTPAAPTTMNENIYPQIYDQKVGQISQIIFSFSLRSPRLRGLFSKEIPQ